MKDTFQCHDHDGLEARVRQHAIHNRHYFPDNLKLSFSASNWPVSASVLNALTQNFTSDSDSII